MAPRTSSSCIDAHDSYAQTLWWAQVLKDFVIDDDGVDVDPDLDERGPEGPDDRYLLLPKVPDPKTVENRVHVCIRPTDRSREEEVDRIHGLGATVVDDRRTTPERGWAGPADPEGNEFCVLAPERRVG